MSALAAPEYETSNAAAALRILFLVDQLTELGGGERVLLMLARSLQERGARVAIATFQDGVNARAYEYGCELHVFPLTRTYNAEAARVALRLRGLIHKKEINLVHTFFETSDTFGAVAARLSGVRTIVSSRRDMGILRSRKHAVAYQLLTPLYARVLTVSEQVRQQTLLRDRPRASRVVAIPNGVDFERFAPLLPDAKRALRSLYGLPPDCALVTTVANMQRWKRLDVFVRCTAEVAAQDPNAHFAIAGQFSDAAVHREVLSLVDQLGLAQKLHLLGELPHAADLLRASDVFCLLSDSEGLPNVVLEAMAAGLPVVATRVGGTPEALDEGATGFLVKAGDAHSAAAHVCALLRDRSLRQAMGARGLARVRARFSLERMVESHEAVYRCVAEEAQRR